MVRFYCCDNFKRDYDEWEIESDWRFCPWCGQRCSINGS